MKVVILKQLISAVLLSAYAGVIRQDSEARKAQRSLVSSGWSVDRFALVSEGFLVSIAAQVLLPLTTGHQDLIAESTFMHLWGSVFGL